MTTATLHAFAKLNLSLFVYAPQENGLHPIVSVFQTVSLADTLRITPRQERGITIHVEGTPISGQNILSSTYDLVCDQIDHGFEIHLTKRIPMGAGLGGGSSNAAAFLTYLNQNYLQLSTQDLQSIAFKLGSDVPFFLNGGTALVTGCGDKIAPFTHPQPYTHFILLYPNIACPTPTIYRNFDSLTTPQSEPQDPPNSLSNSPIVQNDLASAVYQHVPMLRELKAYCQNRLNQALTITGSGSTAFLAYTSSVSQPSDFDRLKKRYPDFQIFSVTSTPSYSEPH